MVATEVVVVVDAVMVAGPITDQDQEVMRMATMAMTTRVKVKKKGRKFLNLILLENNMLMCMIW